MNYFELFDIPSSPVVEQSLLAKKYFELQRKYHPDFYSQATENEKEEALDLSADINNAYTIFQNSEKTLEYFLQLSGTIEPGEKYELPPDFLIEMMELNEGHTEDDNESTSKLVDDYLGKLSNEIDPIIKKCKEGHKDEDLQKLKAWYYKKKYLKRILDRLGD